MTVTTPTLLWPCNEQSGTRRDAAGNNHGTDNNTVGFTAGKFGNAALFVAANSEYLSAASNATLQVSGIDWAACGWFKFNATTTCGLFGKSVNVSPTWEVLAAPASSQVYFRGYTASGWSDLGIRGGQTLNTGTWYFFALRYVAATRTLSVDVDNSGTWADLVLAEEMLTGTDPFQVGKNLGGFAYFDGAADHVAFWKGTPLTDAGWAELYDGGLGLLSLTALRQDYVKLYIANVAAASITTPAPTTTEPTGDGVIDCEGYSWAELVFYGVRTAADNETFTARVSTYRPVYHGNLWVPEPLLALNLTQGTAVGVAGSDVVATEYFADTATVATAYLPAAEYAVTSPADNTLATVKVALRGARKLQVQLAKGSNASCNVLCALT